MNREQLSGIAKGVGEGIARGFAQHAETERLRYALVLLDPTNEGIGVASNHPKGREGTIAMVKLLLAQLEAGK